MLPALLAMLPALLAMPSALFAMFNSFCLMRARRRPLLYPSKGHLRPHLRILIIILV